jgi:glycosyltransferase involved in cell wall biosynthesis
MSYSKNQLAFIDLFFHKKTKSTYFLRLILKKNFNVQNFWNTKYKKQQIQNYSHILFFQIFPSIWTLISLRKSKIVWVPMYDSLSNLDSNIWKICSFFPNIKILSFSKKINQFCIQNKLNYLYCKYFLKPQANTTSVGKKIKNLFWYRGKIKLHDWIDYIDLNEVECINYYTLIDPFYKKENFTKDDIKKYKLNIIKGNYKSDKKKFLKLLNNSDVFVSPRTKEGIGMSFIEALSKSKYVLAYNYSTMSDYIINDKYGYLFKKKTNKLKKINLNKIKNYSKNRYKFSQLLYKEWLSKKKNIESIYDFKINNINSFFSVKFLILFICNVIFETKNKAKLIARKFLNIKYKKL